MWFFSTIIYMVWFSKTPGYKWLMPVVMGEFFLVVGTGGLIATLKVSQDKRGVWLPALFIVIGALVAGGGVLYHYGLLWFW